MWNRSKMQHITGEEFGLVATLDILGFLKEGKYDQREDKVGFVGDVGDEEGRRQIGGIGDETTSCPSDTPSGFRMGRR